MVVLIAMGWVDGAIKFENEEWQAFTMNKDNLFGMDTDFSSFDLKYTDLESSNRVMDSAFDFDSAASSPMPPNNASKAIKKPKSSTKQAMVRLSIVIKSFNIAI